MDYASQLVGSHYRPKKPMPMPIPKTMIRELGEQLADDQTKSLLYALYLTGARASEIIALKTNDFETVDDEYGRTQIRVSLKTLKHRSGMPFRTIPLRSSSDVEEEMLKHVLRHKVSFERVGLNKLFPWTRGTIWAKLKDLRFTTTLVYVREHRIEENMEWHVFPHFLRHCRATSLVTDYGFQGAQLQQFFGWSSLLPASVYVNLDWRDASRLLLGVRGLEASSPPATTN